MGRQDCSLRTSLGGNLEQSRGPFGENRGLVVPPNLSSPLLAAHHHATHTTPMPMPGNSASDRPFSVNLAIDLLNKARLPADNFTMRN